MDDGKLRNAVIAGAVLIAATYLLGWFGLPRWITAPLGLAALVLLIGSFVYVLGKQFLRGYRNT